MPRYQYTATSETNKTTSGSLDANDETSVIEALKKQNLRPLSVTLERKKSKFSVNNLLGGNKVKSDDLVVFTRQLSAMVSAGVPLLRSLSSLEQHSESPALKGILVGVIKDVEGGSTLGDALDKYPNTFSDVYVNMVRAGETAGILDEILKRLALQQEKNSTIRKKVKSAMTYPMVLMFITVIGFFGLMLFVIPQIGKILTDLSGGDGELPAVTLAMLAISDFILAYWFIVIPAFFGGVWGVLRYIKTPKGKKLFHRFVLKVPAVNGVIRKVIIARFARTFSSLNGAGVSILETLTVTAHALGNKVYEEALLDSIDQVKNGQQLSHILEADDLFPSIVSQMLSVGEETGQTDVVLIKVAEFYEEEVDTAIASLSSIIEPVMIVIMGSAVGLIAVSVMGPIASLAQNIQG
ncbi:secretion system protein [Candidatus Saccharibacteria bacterium RIFCSPHIGHO2_01_FULL_45_15]|nr:MAG: secretion system protein [Candidatus Saccharibacteria bacterium RIFCSPHIGHO2_01_FULL_45_15]OGL27078.1 MAG: secretion system protein [Candidatus Saccharibacteria bacterium RIFCSPHIGHO2_02_FULL_46_12]OGL32530.1 MAG: secretion system protein [Candidatus Saccharibacteria bacterium RIFCSPHIGHO2_12_FULL_44_22]